MTIEDLKESGRLDQLPQVSGKPEEVASAGEVDRLLAGVGRDIDKGGRFEPEFEPDRTRDDIRDNRPGRISARRF